MTLDDDVNDRLHAAAAETKRGHAAYHEAGHALVGTILGQTLLLVTVEGQGHTSFEGVSDDPDQILAHAKIALAGTVGEALGMGGSHPDGPKSDFAQAAELLKRLGPGHPRAHDLMREVQHLVVENEPALHRIARALLAEGRLTQDRVKELLAEPKPS